MKEYIDPEIIKWVIAVLFVSTSVFIYFAHHVEFVMSALYYFTIPSADDIEESIQIYRTKAWQQNYVHLDKSLLPVDHLLESLQSNEKKLVCRWVFLNKEDYHRNKELFEFSTATAQYFDNNLGQRIKKNVPQFMYAHDTLGEQKPLLLLVKCVKKKKTYFPLAMVLSAEGDTAPSHQLLYEEAKLLMEKVETVAIADMGSLSLCDSMDSLHELFNHMRFQKRRLPL